jgi:type I restriction enzyme S subunit
MSTSSPKTGSIATDVGELPADWSSTCLGNHFEITSSKRVFQKDWRSSGVAFYRARELAVLAECGRVDNELFIDRTMFERYRKEFGAPEPGDIMVTGVGTLGKTYVVKTGDEFYFKDGNIIWLKCSRSVDSEFLRQLYLSPLVIRQIFDSSSGTTVGTYTITNAKKTRIPLPPRGEQSRVAQALGDADRLISSTARLISKKRAIKQGMMQQLLTGKTRLPGFTAEWTVKGLAELATIDPEALTSQTSPTEIIDYISLEDVSRGTLGGSSKLAFKDAPSRARRVIREMDVLFGTVRPNLQSHVIYVGGLTRPIASTGFSVVRATSGRADPRFLFFLLMSNLAVVQIDRIIAGSNYPAVTSGDVRRLRFDVPDVQEQAAIGATLADCDAELEILQLRLSKARAVKQGMMQELLTGRTRLQVKEPAL